MRKTQRFSEDALLKIKDLEAKTEAGVYTKEISRSGTKTVRDDGGKSYQCYEQNDEYKDENGNAQYTVVHFIEKDGDYHSGHVNAHENGSVRTMF